MSHAHGEVPTAGQHQVPMQGGAHGGQAAHNEHAGHDPDAFRRQFWVILILTIAVVIWSAEVQHWLGYMAPVFPGSEWIPAVLGTITFAYGGKVFLLGARAELGPPAGDDDAHQPRHRGRILDQSEAKSIGRG